MCSIVSEVASFSERLLESAVVVYAFAVELFGLDRALFGEDMINVYEKRNKPLALILRRIGAYLDEDGS